MPFVRGPFVETNKFKLGLKIYDSVKSLHVIPGQREKRHETKTAATEGQTSDVSFERDRRHQGGGPAGPLVGRLVGR